MKKAVSAMAALALLSAPAYAQVRPQDCLPVLPVLDPVAQAVPPQDLVAVRAEPVPVGPRRGFLGLPFLPLALAGLGGLAALVGGGDDDPRFVSPA